MKAKIALILLTLSPLVVSAEGPGEPQSPAALSKAAISDLFGNLKGTLQTAMKAGGPVNAIEVCNTSALPITDQVSKEHGVQVSRTSLKTRNPLNAPDPWERAVLERFEERKASGEEVASITYSETVEVDGKKQFRFMKAIPTGKVCLACHGSELAKPVQERLSALYPEDQAVGFQPGDIRGAFTTTLDL